MGLSSFRAWLRDLPECLFPTTRRKRRPSRKVRRFRPQVLLLEDRCLLDAALGDLALADPFAELASADNLLRDPLGQEPPALVSNLAPSGNAAAPGTSSTGGGAGGAAVSGPSTTTAGPSPDGAPVQQALLEGMASGQPEAPSGAGAGSYSLTGPAAPASAPASSGAGASSPPVSLVAATSGGTLAALGSGTGAVAASSSLLSTSSHGTSFTLTGAVGAEVSAFAAAAEWGGSSGTLTLSEVPADALIEFATLYATLEQGGPVTASATFAGQSLGDASPYSILEITEPFSYVHSAYKWDVTALVTGNDSYGASITGDGYSYGMALVVAFSHPDLPAGSVVVNDGLVDVSTGHSGPDSESTTLEALAGSYDLWVHTVGDDGPEEVGYGNQTDEQILFNDTPVGGPLDHNLGLYASLLRVPVTTVDGTNSVTITSQDDWLSWDVTVLATRNPGGNQIHFDLDVNDDKDLDDPADGVSNYLPGYGPDDPASADTTPKLSSGEFDATSYAPQRLNLVIEGVGSSSVYDEVLFVIEDVTNYEGFAENASDPLVEGEGATDDYSFLPYEDSREAYGTMEADRTWVPFWAKDYGGWARVQVFGLIGATSVLLAQKDVPLDADGDGLADKWELEQITQWENQYWITVTRPDKLSFFSPNLDDEERDPDGDGNGDGGTNLPAHKTKGDSLTVLQEYRGFTLDGGGHDWDGNNPHGGGHTRLSPVFKELLVETDIMKDVPNMPTLDEIKTVLNTTAKGFSNKNDGAGIRMYWVIDEKEVPHTVPTNDTELGPLLTNHRNARLGEFVHLMYADHATHKPRATGTSSTPGTYIFIKWNWDQADDRADFLALLPSTTAHELTHLLLDTISANGFDAGEHLRDPDPSDPPDGPKDQKYLMFIRTNRENYKTIIFDNRTRAQIDLTSKESVERT